MKLFAYNTEKCSIKGCNHVVFRNYMCQEHYAHYITDSTIEQVNNDIYTLTTGSASFKLKMKKIIAFIIHHTFDIPFLYIEHFPLEHIFLYHKGLQRSQENKDMGFISKLVDDFDVEKNENISDLKEFISNGFSDKPRLELSDYTLSNKHLPSYLYLVIGIIALLGSYTTYSFGDITFSVNLIHFLPYCFNIGSVLFIVFLFGFSFTRKYNGLIQKAYKNELFEEESDNLIYLNKIRFIRDRREKSGSYLATTVGGITGKSIVLFFILKDNIYCYSQSLSLIFILFTLIAFSMMIYCNNIMALYSSVIYTFKHKKIAIKIYNSDHVGGTSMFQSYLFNCFLYNEGVLTLVYIMFVIAGIEYWYVSLMLLPIMLFRSMHGRYCVIFYIKYLFSYKAHKKKELERLSHLNTPESLQNAQLLAQVYPSIWMKNILKFILIIVIPITLSWITNNVQTILQLINRFLSYI